jgi:hypothetical protein
MFGPGGGRNRRQEDTGGDRNAKGRSLRRRRSRASREPKVGVTNGGREIIVGGMGKGSRGKGDGEGLVRGQGSRGRDERGHRAREMGT